MMRDFIVSFSLLGLACACHPAHAERRESEAADAMRRAQLIIRKLSEEKDQLQTDNATLNNRNKELQAKLDGLQKGLDKTRGRLGKAEQSNQHLVDRIRSDVDKFKALMEKYRDSLRTIRSAISDNELLVNAVKERDKWMGQCKARNRKMFEANNDLLDMYKNKDVADVIKDKEPLLGLGRVELERQVQDYRFRLEDLTVTPYKDARPLPPRASAEALAR